MKRMSLPAMIGISLVLFLSGCGGGGGGGGGVTSESTDKAMTDFSFSQTANPSNKAVTTDITAAISGTNITATVPYGTDISNLVATFAFDGANVQVAGVDQTSGVTSNNFVSPVAYTVFAEDGTTQDYTVTVTRTDKSWGEAVVIETETATVGSHFQVAFDGAGNAFAVWVQDHTVTPPGGVPRTDSSIWGNWFTPAGGWQANAGVVETMTNTAGLPFIASSPEGHVVVAWRHTEGSGAAALYHIWVRRYTMSGGNLVPVVGSMERIDTGNTEWDTRPIGLQCDSSGNFMIMWEQDSATGPYLRTKYFDHQLGTWGPAVDVRPGFTGAMLSPRFSMNSMGNAYAAWCEEDSSPGFYIIYYTTYNHSSGWGAVRPEATDEGTTPVLSITADSLGNFVLVREYSIGDGYDIRATFHRASGESIYAEMNPSADTRSHRTALDGKGNAFVVWNQMDASGTRLWAKRYTGAGGWGEPTCIQKDTTVDAFMNTTNIACDAFGNAIVLWGQGLPGSMELWTNRYISGIGWDTDNARIIHHDEYEDPMVSSLAVDSFGNAMAVWVQDTVSGPGDIRSLFARYYR